MKEDEKYPLTGSPTLLGQQRIFIAILSRNVVLLAQVLGRDTHGGLLGETIDQGSGKGILQLQINTETGATETNSTKRVRGEGHGLGTSGQDQVRVANNDLMSGVDDGLETRSAETVDGQGRDGDVQS